MGLRVPEFGLGEPVVQACFLAHLLGQRALGVPEELPKNLSLWGDFGVALEWEKLPALSIHKQKRWFIYDRFSIVETFVSYHMISYHI